MRNEVDPSSKTQFNKVLIIQTAFIGDVILSTPIIEKIHQRFPQTQIDFLLRKGNESLLVDHPHIHKLLIWNKKTGKYKDLLRILGIIRSNRYDVVINLQRFASTGLLTALSKAKKTIGFDKNPFSFLFSDKVPHQIGQSMHEVKRNLQLISKIVDAAFIPPKLYPSAKDHEAVDQYKMTSYICIAPTSVWFTKQFPIEKWISFIDSIPSNERIYLLGAPSDTEACEKIKTSTKHPNIVNLAGKLTLLQSAALMKDAVLNYVNDSAPLHLASAVNANTCAVFCSTVPAFGFYPLANFSEIVEISTPLDCRPCGLHGYKACPLGHFNCAHKINNAQLLSVLNKAWHAREPRIE